MSLILDALNRAEQERKRQDQVPDIHTIHLAPAMPSGSGSLTKRRFAIVGSLLLLVIIGIGYGALRLSTSSTTPPPEVIENAGLPAHSHLSGEVNPTAPPTTTVTGSAIQPVNASAPSRSLAESQVDAAKSDTATLSHQEAAPVADQDIKNLYSADEDNQQSPAATTPEPVAALYSQKEVPTESEAVTSHFTEDIPPALPEVKSRYLDAFPNLPFFNDLPWLQKQKIPTISYSRHNYVPNAVSTVVINGATRGIGNLVPGEFIIEDIVADGVVLRYQDKVFKLPALSGWVNM